MVCEPDAVLELDDPSVWQDLHAAFAPAREASPVHVGRDGSVLVLRHAEATAILKDRAFGATDLLAMYGIHDGPMWEWWRLVMASRNPPEHTRVRATVNRAFTPRQVDTLRPTIAAIAAELLDAASTGDPFDVITGYADQLPARVMAHLLAIPRVDQQAFAAWTTDIGLVFGAAAGRDRALLRHIEGVLGELYDYVGRLSADRRTHPGDDLLSALIAAEATDERLSADELAALVANLLFAGHDTTRSQLMITFQLLASLPEQFAALRTGLTTPERAADEILRYEPAVLGAARQPFEDTTVCGVAVPAGRPVQVSLVSASRDPRAYDEPDRFDVTRADPRPVDFGAGIHHCLGAALARAELQETLTLLTRRVRSLALVETPRWVPYAAIRRFESLAVHVDLD
jgi:cytochrome P450